MHGVISLLDTTSYDIKDFRGNRNLSIYRSYDNNIIEPVHEISNNVVCETSKKSDQPAHRRSLIRAFASRLSIL